MFVASSRLRGLRCNYCLAGVRGGGPPRSQAEQSFSLPVQCTGRISIVARLARQEDEEPPNRVHTAEARHLVALACTESATRQESLPFSVGSGPSGDVLNELRQLARTIAPT